MPWSPVFWIKKHDFILLKSELFELESFKAYPFSIGEQEGIVVGINNESTHAHQELHQVIDRFPHWVLTGEEGCCINGTGWGDELDRYDT